jgi:hypothetical protein
MNQDLLISCSCAHAIQETRARFQINHPKGVFYCPCNREPDVYGFGVGGQDLVQAPAHFVSQLARFVIYTDFGDVRHLLAAFEEQPHLL